MTDRLPKWAETRLAGVMKNIDVAFEEWETQGSNLTGMRRGFFKDVARRDYLFYHDAQLRPVLKPESAMGDERRGRKKDSIEILRRGLRDLMMLSLCTAPLAKDVELRPWFDEEDVRKVLPLNELSTLVRYAVSIFGREYADAILSELNSFYGTRGEEIVIHRDLRVPFGVR